MTETKHKEALIMDAALAFAKSKPTEWDHFRRLYLDQHTVQAEPVEQDLRTPATVDVAVEPVTVPEPLKRKAAEPAAEEEAPVEAAPKPVSKRKRSTS